jgi:hypothetical protein
LVFASTIFRRFMGVGSGDDHPDGESPRRRSISPNREADARIERLRARGGGVPFGTPMWRLADIRGFFVEHPQTNG